MRPETRATYEERILRVQSYLNERLDEEMRLDDLAGVACLSPFHFHRIFRGMTGETVASYVRRLRMQRAASQLKMSGRPVTDIAFGAGYDSLEGFSRAFHEHYGSAPSAWRETQPPRSQDATPHEVRVVHRPVTVAICLRHVGPYGDIGPVFGRLFEWAGRQGLLASPFDTVGMPHDDPDVTPPDKIRCDAAILLGTQPRGPTGLAGGPAGGDVRWMTLPARDYAVVRHTGPYERLSDAYAWLCGVWLPRSGREAASLPPIEFYRNHPPQTPLGQLITDIHLPLEPA
jgi:AraC family transcriptional regulator